MGLVATRGGVHVYRPAGGFVVLKAGDSVPEWATEEQCIHLLTEGLIAVAEPEAVENTAGSGVVDLDALTIAELTAYAAEHSIDLGKATKHADIVAAIQAAPPAEG